MAARSKAFRCVARTRGRRFPLCSSPYAVQCVPRAMHLRSCTRNAVPHPMTQVMVTKEVAEASGGALNKLTATGTSVLIEGELAATPEGTKQARDDACQAHALRASGLWRSHAMHYPACCACMHPWAWDMHGLCC